jgi:tRNA A-37 threonylcarbamoyl transferase component Bud32
MHAAGICHGDLRKQNMCCLDGKASIIDFDQAFESCEDADFMNDEEELEDVLACF